MIQENVRDIREFIGQAARNCGREPSSVRLLAVTKTVDPARIDEALAAGITEIGENRVQEAVGKLPLLTRPYTFHLIGSLQTNKVKAALVLDPVLIHSLDREDLAVALEKQLAPVNRVQDVLIEVNASREMSKHGMAMDEVLGFARAMNRFPHLRLRGLMTIGPLTDDPVAIAACFAEMKRLFDDLSQEMPVDTLSMGMSHDYPLAIQHGATIVRIGTALFGERPEKPCSNI
jgi:pyridoxal phosphate enzyme (YggS family)